ncbi:MAG: hypothetical protein HQL07_07555 [Nitrospirae bacterium]|nr:hypothetical protein [Magnetococcales bacterium]HAT50414.1 hypothetical protein [Alphaproteobacteria bacterium]
MHDYQGGHRFRLLLFLLVIFSLAGCKGEVTVSDLEVRNGVAYLKGGFDPYSGSVRDYYKNADDTNNKLMLEGTYSRGLKTDVWTTYGWNGEKSTVKYEGGLEEGTAEEYFPDGKMKRTIAYSKGRRNGMSIDYDTQGTKIHQFYYRNGFIEPPPSTRKEGSRQAEVDDGHDKMYGKKQITMIDYIMGLF